MNENNYQAVENPVVENEPTVLQFFKNAFSHQLFLAITILMTVSAGFSIVGGSFDVFKILYSIGFWLIYTSASNDTLMNIKGIKFVNGVIQARRIVNWVAVGIIAVCGILCMFVFPLISVGLSDILRDSFLVGDVYVFDSLDIADSAAVIVGIVVGVVLLISAVICALFNIFYINKTVDFVKSLYNSAETNVFGIVNARYVGIWFLVIGIVNALSGLSSFDFVLILSQLSFAAAYIIGYFWIKNILLAE